MVSGHILHAIPFLLRTLAETLRVALSDVSQPAQHESTKRDWSDYYADVAAFNNSTLKPGDEPWTPAAVNATMNKKWGKGWQSKEMKWLKQHIGAGFALMPSTISHEEQVQWLQSKRESGVLRINLPQLPELTQVRKLPMHSLRAEVDIMGYATDEHYFPPAQSVMCFDALLLSGAALDAERLGLNVLPATANRYANFKELNKRWQMCTGLGSLFVWGKMDPMWSLSDIFLSKQG